MNTGSALAQFTITLSQAVTEPVQVEWFTSDGTAKAGVDYAANKGTVVFSPGQTEKTVDILVYGRAVGAEDRSFFVEMLPPTNAILGASIGECIITVDTIGSTPVTQVIVPTGPEGDSAYQVWLDQGNTGTEQDFLDSLKPDPADIAIEVAPLIDVGATILTAEGTETLGHPDQTTVKAVARRIAYVGAAKIATALLAAGDNVVGQTDLTGDTIDLASIGLYPRILRGTTVFSPQWSAEPGGKVRIKDAIAGDVLYACQYDTLSAPAVTRLIEVTAESFGVVSGLVSLAVAKANADKIMQKAAELSAAGGGKIIFTRSLYQVHMNESDFSSSAATIRVAALCIPYDKVILCGQGWDATVIQAYATNSAYTVIQWTKAPLENGVTKVHGVGLHNICIDGNYHGDFTPASYVRQTEGVVGAGIEGLSINNLKVKNCSHYGLGLQNGGYKGCVIDGYWSENTGADGIDIKDNGSVSRAFHLNNIFVFNFGQLDEPNNPWAGVDVMSIAPKVSNVYVSDFGDVGCPGAGVRIKQGPIGSLEGRGSSAWANVSDITVVQNRFGVDYTTLIGLHIKAPFVNFNNIVAIGDEGGRLKNGVWIEERHCRGSNIQIANAEDGLSVTASTSGTSTGREYGNGDDTVINGLVCRDVSRAAIINRKYAKLSGVTFKDCPVGFVSAGSGSGKIVIKGLHLENVPNPFGLMGGTLHSITDVTGPSSANWQAGIGVIKGASDLAATIITSKNSIRLYSGSTEDSLGTELGRFAPTVSDVFSPLRLTGNLQTAAANTYYIGTSSTPWAGGYTQAPFTVTSDERHKSRPVMLARGSLEFVVTSDQRLMEMPYADDILDAWAEVDFVQFQFIDRIEAKGEDGARWHVGIIAQRAQEAFIRHGLDPHRFAFFCYDPEETVPAVYESVPAVYEVVPAVYDAEGHQVSPELWNMTQPAHEKLVAESYVVGEKYGIRYEEALVIEAAYQRRNHDRLLAQYKSLEARINALETGGAN